MLHARDGFLRPHRLAFSTTSPVFLSSKRFYLIPILALPLAAAGILAATGAYGAFKINRSRARWFSDSFVLSPESLRMPYRKIHLETEDHVKLEGWYIEQTLKGKPSERVVLCCNPYNHDKSTLLAVARALWDTGHSVLLFDFRSFGPEKVPHETIGYLELRDARAALGWLRENKPQGAKIGLMGCSMGGAMSLCLAIEDDTDIVGVATDCAFACLEQVVWTYVSHLVPGNLPHRHKIIDLIVASLNSWNVLLYGYDLSQVGPAGLGLGKLKVPLLVVHSELDSVVPVEQGRRIYQESATSEAHKHFFLVKECEHIGSFFANEIQYTKRIVHFLDKCFDEEGSSMVSKK